MKRISRDARGVYWMEGINAISWEPYKPDESDPVESIHVHGNRATIRTSRSMIDVEKDSLIHRVYRAQRRAMSKASPDHDEVDYSDADMMIDPEDGEQN